MDKELKQGLEAVRIRPAQASDARVIATFYDIATDGVSLYVWAGLRDDYPGLDLFDIGTERFRREDTEYSYQNCLIAEAGVEIAGMVHGWVMPEGVARFPDERDPVLLPFAELEAPGTFYISSLALFEKFRGLGIGTKLLQAAQQRAEGLGASKMSLICFEENTGARRLYERHGFEVVKRRAMVPHPLIRVTGDALLMVQRR